MIKILGFENSSEYSAAQKILNSLINLWPDLDKSVDDNILVMSGCKIFGYEVQDIDIVIVVELGKLKESIFIPFSKTFPLI